MPFNDYSGNYSAVNYKCYIKGAESEAPFVKNYVMTYVVDDQSLFFYAGIIDETRVDRKGYRILAKFIIMIMEKSAMWNYLLQILTIK